jgi:hypothetical protein
MHRPILSLLLALAIVTARGQDSLQRLAKIKENDAEMKSLVFAKSFCVAMRRNHQLQNPTKLLQFIDPRYLAEHKINTTKPNLETFPLFNIYDIKISTDPSTILCLVDTKGGPRQALLLRTNTSNGKLHLNPVAPPSKANQSFTPWILRMQAAPALDGEEKNIIREKRLLAGILRHFPQDVKSVEAWEGSEFKIGDSTIIPTKEITRDALLKFVGQSVSITGYWNPGENQGHAKSEKFHSHPILPQGGSDIVGAGLEAISIRRID